MTTMLEMYNKDVKEAYEEILQKDHKGVTNMTQLITMQIKDQVIKVKVPEIIFNNLIESFHKGIPDAKIWIPDSSCIEISNVTLEFMINKNI